MECFEHRSDILEKITLEFVYPTKHRECQGGSGEISEKKILIIQPGRTFLGSEWFRGKEW